MVENLSRSHLTASNPIMEKETILVGVDGSKESLQALSWGAERARRCGAKLQILCAYALPSYTTANMETGIAVLDTSSIKDSAKMVVEEAAEMVRDLPVDLIVEAGDPTEVLVKYSREVSLIVVGTRGGGGFADRLLGSTSAALPAHTHCPVVVVPRKLKDPERKYLPVTQIVVGVDGSGGSTHSLSAAISEAELWGAELTAVEAVPMASSAGVLAWLPATVDREAILEEVRHDLRRVCDKLGARREVKIRYHALDGNPAALLTEFSTAAEMIVVGTRGGGGFTGMLLGSTSQSVLAHSTCPIMVVPQAQG